MCAYARCRASLLKSGNALPARGENGRDAQHAVERFAIIDSTLREGEQFVNAFFTTAEKVRSRGCSTNSAWSTSSSLAGRVPPARTRPEDRLGPRTEGEGPHPRALPYRRRARCGVDRCGRHGHPVRDVLVPARVLPRKERRRDHPGAGAGDRVSSRPTASEVRFWSEDSSARPRATSSRSTRPSTGGVNRVGVADTVGIATPRQCSRWCRSSGATCSATSSSTGTTTRAVRSRTRSAPRGGGDPHRHERARHRRAQRHHATRRPRRADVR